MNKQHFFLIGILLLGALFRFYGLNWDQGFHLHPDERAIVMFTTSLHLPTSIAEFFSSESSWNPHFFAYGSFPLYLLKIVSSIFGIFDPRLTEYSYINLLGRVISAFVDTATVLLVYFFGKKLFSKHVGILAAFFYAISVFPIQAAHFYAVDALLTFFIMLNLFSLLRFYQNPTIKNALFTGMIFGFALATKISATVLLASIGTALFIDFVLIFLKNPHRPHVWFPHLPKLARRLMVEGLIIIIITIITFIILEPYAIIDFRTFWEHNLLQSQMTHNAFIFPYTLQYVGKIPYFYELKNVFLFGLGPVIALLSFLGTLYLTFKTMKQSNNGTIIILVFFWIYFFTAGRFAVGWMRYMLPLYPFFCLFAAMLFFQFFRRFSPSWRKLFTINYLLLTIMWPIAFMNIHTKSNTRVTASEWINKNIPPGKTLAIEHWDDGLPLFGQQRYKMVTLPLYDPDTYAKWQTINQQLATTDYIILASNRLYVPLMKLTDCKKLPVGRCYMQTAEYYKRLFSGQNVILSTFDKLSVNSAKNPIRFQKVAEFTVSPTIPLLTIPIDDQPADESFTVYDHPKVIIFKRE